MPATLVLDRPGVLLLRDDVPPPEPGPGEALVGTRCVGLCGTDHHAYHGRQPFFTYPRILGHELAVQVVAVGPGVANVRPNQPCAVVPYVGCGSCIACQLGRPNCCEHVQVLGVHTDGGLRPTFTVRAENLLPADDLDDERLVLVEPLAVGAHAVRRANVGNDDVVLVIGAGPIGLSALLSARARGARVVALDRDPGRRTLAATLGLAGVLKPMEQPAATEAMLRDTLGELPSVVIDATGNAASMNAAFRYVSAGGRLVFVGLHQGDVTFQDPEFHRRELTLLASRNATREDFSWVIGRLRDGQIDTSAWITHRISPAELPDAMAALSDPRTKCLKALVRFL